MANNLPASGSKNPVIGVIRCPYCNDVATVHEAQRRGKHRYTICPVCGTDQKTGKPFQAYIAANMVESMDDLPSVAPPLGLQTESKPTEPTETKPKQTEVKPNQVTEPDRTDQPNQTEPGAKKSPVFMALGLLVLLLLGGLVAFFSSGKKQQQPVIQQRQ